MKKIVQMMFVAALALTFSADASYAAKKPTVKNRQINQQKRIKGGVQSGDLTRPEAVRLQKNAARIHHSVLRDRRDGGVFTPRERAQSQRKLNRQSRAIYRQKSDQQVR